MTTTTQPLQPGDEIHILSPITIAMSLTTSSGARVYDRGDTVVVTAEMIAASENRLGQSWLDLVDDAVGQELLWGSVRFARGPWPEDQPKWVFGDARWQDERESARKRAWAVQDPQARADALAEVTRQFGPHVTSRTLTYRKPQEQR